MANNIRDVASTVNANITGNASGNTITGNGGNNLLKGEAGNDTMRVDEPADAVTDSGGTADTVIAGVDGYVLANGNGIERLVLGTGSYGWGNSSANLLVGNGGNNNLFGGGGGGICAATPEVSAKRVAARLIFLMTAVEHGCVCGRQCSASCVAHDASHAT